MKINAIIFDLDGTLIDSLPGIQFSVDYAVAAVSPGLVTPDLRPFIGPPIREIIESALPSVPAKTLDAIAAKFRSSYDDVGWRRTELFSTVLITLKRLRDLGIRQFLASNKPSHIATRICDSLHISDYFEAACYRDSAVPPFASKSAVVDHLVDSRQLVATETMFIGDCRDDYQAAIENGLYFLHAGYGYGTADFQTLPPDTHRLASLADLLEFVD